MCETKAFLVPLSLVLLVAARFWVFQAHTQKKVGRHSKIERQSPF